MSLLEERILRIIELREKGLEEKGIAKELGLKERTIRLYEEATKKAISDSVLADHEPEQIAKNIGLSLITLNLVTSHYNIKIPQQIQQPSKKIYKSRTEKINEIKQAIAEGADSVKKISERTGLTVGIIYACARIPNIKLPMHNKPQEQRIIEIKQAIANGVNSIEEISERTGLKISTIVEYAKKEKIKLPFPKKDILLSYGTKRDKKRDRLIRKGFSLRDIGEKVGVSREAIRQYIDKTGQYEKWKKSKKHYKNGGKYKKLRKREEFSKIATAIDLIARQKLKEDEKWAYDKTTEYFSLVKSSSYPFNTLFSFFKKYNDAKRVGKKLSLEELGKDSNIWFSAAGKILEKVEEEPLFGTLERKIIPKEKKEALGRASKIKMDGVDISYFLGLNKHVVQANLRASSKKKQRKSSFKAIAFFGRKRLTYRLASEIYEAQDLGFSKKETIYLLDTSKEIFDYTNQHRAKIEPRIIAALKILYPKKEITKPYIDFEQSN